MSQGPVVPIHKAERPIDPGVRVGHVHLRTADIDRIKDFYVGVLGFDAVKRLRGADVALRQVSDHGTHLAVYVSDPDGNDLELAWDRSFDEWPRDEAGHVLMAMDDAVDLEALVAEAG